VRFSDWNVRFSDWMSSKHPYQPDQSFASSTSLAFKLHRTLRSPCVSTITRHTHYGRACFMLYLRQIIGADERSATGSGEHPSAPAQIFQVCPTEPLGSSCSCSDTVLTDRHVTHGLEMASQDVEACSEWRRRHKHATFQPAVSAQRYQSLHGASRRAYFVPEN
jgi:hypothetical protein